MDNSSDFNGFKDFYRAVCKHQLFTGAFIEVVRDFKTSKYFTDEQTDEIADYVKLQSEAGHQVFFGPALRKDDLGSKRSNDENIMYMLSLWVDIDSPDKSLPADERLEQAQILLGEFIVALTEYNIEPSFIVESGHGYHVYFIVHQAMEHPNENWENAQIALINMAKADMQAKDPTRLMRAPGSINYKDPGNPKPVTIIHASEKIYFIDDFRRITNDYRLKVKKITKPSGSNALGFTPPCIASLLDPQRKPPSGHRHLVRQIISTHFFKEGYPVEETIGKVMHTTDHPGKAESDVRGVYKTLERDPERYSVGCGEGSHLRTLVDDGIAVCDEKSCQFKNPKAENDNEKKEVMSAWFDGLVDIVIDGSDKICFLVKENGMLAMKDRHDLPDHVLVPPPSDAIIWQVPKYSEVLKYVTGDSDAQLFQDLVQYHRSISELPDDNHYNFLAAWDMHTYLMEKFEYYPIIWFYAIPARGKSRTAKGITYVSWRGVILTTVKEAHIIRLATNHRATLFFDIMDLWKKVERGNVDDIMLHRFERGGKVPRVLDPDKGPFKDTTWFDIYGPTIIATNKTINEILETRSIQIVMPETTRIFENDVKEANALPFRERLVAFRARWIDRQLPTVTKPVAGRLGDILKPIRQIVNLVGQGESWFQEFAQQVEESKKRDGLDSDDAKILNVIVQSMGQIEHGHLLHRFILDEINGDRPERYHMSPQRLGRITKRLGFKKYNSGESRGIYIDADLLNRLCQRYGIKQDDGVLTI